MSLRSGPVAGMERHQLAVYGGALAAGGVVGSVAPGMG
ncbi:arsenic resistance protein, partial [Streptomyces hainanensis]